MCEIGYCSLVTFREVFFVNVVHRKPEKCGAKRVTVNGVNSNTEIGFTSRFKRDFDHAHILCYYKESAKVTLLITE